MEPWNGWWAPAELAARRLAVITATGALLGLLVGGVGGRLAMLLLAELNPEASGVTSDDGFTIGQFTLASLNLLIVGTVLGVVGAGFYAILRGLRVGPRWFQVLSLAVGPAVVVGALIVHTDGVDFTRLEPTWLAIVLFVAIPGGYAALLTVLAERLLQQQRWTTAPRWQVVAVLTLWLPVAPLLLLLTAGWAASEGVRRTSAGAAALGHPGLRWGARLALAVVFAVSLLDLGQDAAALG